MGNAAIEGDEVDYPETDEMGEHEVQWFIARVLWELVVRHLAGRGVRAHVAGNQFFYWRRGEPKAARAPDLYVLPDVAQNIPDVGAWFTWEGHRPSFALEVASGKTWRKDYDEAPADYAAMGCAELVIFDPGATERSRRRVRWQVFRAVKGRGFVRVEATMADAVRCRELDAWLRMVWVDGRPRLRLATGAGGELLVPTDAERAEAERVVRTVTETQMGAERAARQAAEAHAKAEAERAKAEAERASVLAAKLRALGVDPDAM